MLRHRSHTTWIILLAAAYVVLRALLVTRLPIVYDEGEYAAGARAAFLHPSRQTLLLSVRTHHGPLQALFSLGPLALGMSAVHSIRLLSALAGAAGAAGVAFAAKAVAGPRAALIAAALWIALPFTLVYDSFGIGDGVAAAMVGCAIYLGLRMAERPSVRAGALLGLAFALGILAKESAALALLVVPLTLLVFDWSAPERRARGIALITGLGLATAFAVAALLVPRLAPEHIRMLRSLTGAGLMHSPDQLVTNYAVLARTNAPAFDDALVGYFGVPFLLLSVAGAAVVLWRRIAGGVVVVATLLVSATLVYGLAVIPWPRYLSVLVPGLIVLAAVALSNVRRPLFAAVVAGLALAAPLWLSARIVASPDDAPYPSADEPQFVSDWPAGTAWPAISAALVSTAPEATRTTVAYAGQGPPYGLAAQIGRPYVSVDAEGRTPAGEVEAARDGHRFVLRPLLPGMRPTFILDQPTTGRLRTFAIKGYKPLVRYRRPHGGATVTLWQRV